MAPVGFGAKPQPSFLSNPTFQRWALKTPVIRWEARRRARAAFDLVAGFVYSQILAACVELDLFERLRAGPASLATLAAEARLPPDAMRRLLEAAESLKLLRQRGGGWRLGATGAAMLANPGIFAMIRHHRLFYADLADPVALLRGQAGPTALAAFWPYAAQSDPAALGADRVADYSSLMAASQPVVAAEILDACPMGRFGCLLDVGGGEGAFLIEAARRHPSLRLMLFDLPAVADRARARFAQAGLSDRAQAIGGSFLEGCLPRGSDILSLVRVVHDQDDQTARRLLRMAHDALPPGGVLLLAEPMAGAAGAEPVGDAYFGFYLLAMGRGQARRPEQLHALLAESGFRHIRTLTTAMPMLTGAILARA